jgi:hypothetical protein
VVDACVQAVSTQFTSRFNGSFVAFCGTPCLFIYRYRTGEFDMVQVPAETIGDFLVRVAKVANSKSPGSWKTGALLLVGGNERKSKPPAIAHANPFREEGIKSLTRWL